MQAAEPETSPSAPSATKNVGRLTACRADFPILAREYHGGRLAFLDNGASTQKPRAVIDAMRRCMEEYYANVHRGAYELSVRATEASEALRGAAARRINAPDERNASGDVANIVFVRGTTEAINLVAQSWGRSQLREGDVVMLTQLEHHANVIPWHMLAAERGIRLAWIPVRPDDGRLDMAAAEALIARHAGRLRLVSVAHASNVLGTINDVNRLCRLAHEAGALCLVDGAQAVAHLGVDVQAIDCDFYAFSGHKIYGPTGIGILYARAALLEAMPAWMGGGGMIAEVREDGWRPLEIPGKFEAGTPAFVEEIGLAEAFAYLDALGAPADLLAHEQSLTAACVERLRAVPGLTIWGPPGEAADRIGVVSFTLAGLHPHDLATVLDEHGVCVRSGHHCAQPLMRALGIAASTRASFAVYNDLQDVDQLIEGIHHARKIFQ